MNSKFASGDSLGAQESSRKAKLWVILSAVIGPNDVDSYTNTGAMDLELTGLGVGVLVRAECARLDVAFAPVRI